MKQLFKRMPIWWKQTRCTTCDKPIAFTVQGDSLCLVCWHEVDAIRERIERAAGIAFEAKELTEKDWEFLTRRAPSQLKP